MKVAVVGCGYVGLVSAVGLAHVGHHVVGVETHAPRRAAISTGRPPFREPGLEELLRAALDAGTFQVSSEVTVAADADVVLLAVQTPPAADGSNDLRFLGAAADDLARAFLAAPPRPRVVAVRSTVVPGTLETVVAPFFAPLPGVAVAANPEFLREGTALDDFLHPDRIVVGCADDWAVDVLKELYRPMAAPVLAMSPPAAELSKYASNALLATLVSFANEIGSICARLPDVDVEDVLGAVHLDRRMRGSGGRPADVCSYLKAGCGYGGSCLPKDVSALIAYCHTHDHRPALLEAVRGVNDGQPSTLVAMAEAALGELAARRVAVVGVAFKGGTDDLRESPGLRIIDVLLSHGAAVTVFDPLVGTEALAPYAARGVRVAASLDEVLTAEACLVTTNAPEFAALEDLVASCPDPPLVIDGRRHLRAERFPAGRYRAVGRGHVNGGGPPPGGGDAALTSSAPVAGGPTA